MVNRIYGLTVDRYGRCRHYHSERDIIANKCAKCGTFWACYRCHDCLTDHTFVPCGEDEAGTVLCGSCQETFSYVAYEGLDACPRCGHVFNPGCKVHKGKYVR